MKLDAESLLRKTVFNLATEGYSQRQISSLTGLGKSTIGDWLIADNFESGQDVDPVEFHRRKVVDAQQRQEHIEAVKELSFRELLQDVLGNVAQTLDAPPRYRSPRISTNTVTESLLLCLSDWHADEIVRADAVFGLNEYNRDVMDRRIVRIRDTVLEIKERLESGGHRFPTLVVSANGDMVSGTIHEVERHTDGPNIMQTSLRCGSKLAELIRDLSGHFEQVHVVCTSGNHGRLGDAKKVQTKEPTRSWDYLIYKYAEAMLAQCENVTFEVPDAWAVMFELEGKLFYQGHGHFVKSWNSVPFYGISRMTSRLGSVLSRHHQPIDYYLFGHFHIYGSIENAGGEYIINPPLIGPQEFGVHSFGDAVPPGQLLLGVHHRHGVTHRWRLAAEDVWPPPSKALKTTKIGSK